MTRHDTRFMERFAELFHGHFHRIVRYLDRMGGDPELAADLAQEAFVRLLRRGTLPDAPEAWLISVAMNLLRNAASTRARRRRLLGWARPPHVMGDPPPEADAGLDGERVRARVRAALNALPERDRAMLLLRAEGYTYREIAGALGLLEASVGTLLARARASFKDRYGNVET